MRSGETEGARESGGERVCVVERNRAQRHRASSVLQLQTDEVIDLWCRGVGGVLGEWAGFGVSG